MAERESRQLARRVPPRGLVPLEEMERVFDDFFRHPLSLLGQTWWPQRVREMEEAISPNADVYEEGDSIVVKAEIPGISKEDIEVSFSDNTVIISGEKKKEEQIERKNYYQLERVSGAFRRSFYLPAEVDSEKASAKFKDGILEIRIPKTEASRQKAKKITIQ